MSFLVTARKWRPQKFSEVVGQEHITETLKNAVRGNRIAHAYLFTGPRGVGKTTTARLLAKTLNCLNPDNAEPCNNCEMCSSIINSQSMDIIEIDGASNRGIDEIRTLRDSVKYAPARGKYKIYIIDEVHMLTKESFNAFLKTLEEPPSHTIFIFATTDIHKVPLTIISRCQRFDFRRIQLETIKNLLMKIAEAEGVNIDDKTLTIIAKKADGALRDAESFFDQVVSFCGKDITAETVSQMLNLIDDEIYFTISDAVLSKDYSEVFSVTGKIYENGWSFTDFTDGLIEHFRNILSVQVTGSTNLIETAEVYKQRYLNYTDRFIESDLLILLNFLNKTQQELRFSQNHRLKLEIALSHLIGFEKSTSISSLISRLGKGEGFTDMGTEADSKPSRISLSVEAEPVKNTRSSVSKRNENVLSTKVVREPMDAESDFKSDFKSVIQKWEGFVKVVSDDKGLILGPSMMQLKPRSLSGTKLNAYIGDPAGRANIMMFSEYLERKAMEYFGRKITITLVDSDPDPLIKDEPELSVENTVRKPGGDSPVVNAIISQLGGEEIR